MRLAPPRRLAATVCGLGLLAATPALAANAQQELMKTCNAKAKDQQVAGAARKDFMSHCLKGEPVGAAPQPATPQERMKACNADPQAKTLRGDARKSFIATCLRKS